jgi:predicted DNA-binding transcriptional regulator YafY
MPTNKNAIIRYHALDRCFSNFGRKYFIEDLVKVCNDDLYEFCGIEDGVKKRQVFDDITFMESDQGWSIPLKRIRDGKRVYYRYEDISYSIKNLGLNQTEAEQLNDTLVILSRFKGLPQFEWIDEMLVRVEDTFKLKNISAPSVSFEQNPYLKGLKYFSVVFNAIKNKESLIIRYKSFKEKIDNIFVFHPWHLKQYNNRWFLFGFNEAYQGLSNLAIDRIISIEQSRSEYIENEDIDFDEYFEDVIGVSVDPDQKTEIIIINVNKSLWPYIENKPIHGSQRVLEKNEDFIKMELELKINYELKSLLFSFMDGIEIIEPKVLRNELKDLLNKINCKYI